MFAQVVAARAGCRNSAIHQAFARVPRHAFLGPGPWQLNQQGDVTPSADPALVYQDMGLGLAPERGIPTGLPSLHARCMAACMPQPGDHVVHIGAGTGYYTAILAELVGEAGEVLGFEVDPELAARANNNLGLWPWARVEARSGAHTPFAPADVVYVSTGVQEPPRHWFEALRPRGGRLLFPLTPGGALWPSGAEAAPAAGADPDAIGGILLVRRQRMPHVFAAEFILRAHFVPSIGTEDQRSSTRLTEAFRSGTCQSVRSLRLFPEPPDAHTWFLGNGWWLSTLPA